MCEIQASLFYRFNAKTVAMATQQSCCKRLSPSAPSLLCSPTRYTGTRRRRVIMICRLQWGVDRRGPTALSFISTSLSVIPMRLLIGRAFTLSVSVLLLKRSPPLNPNRMPGDTGGKKFTEGYEELKCKWRARVCVLSVFIVCLLVRKTLVCVCVCACVCV